MIYQTVWQCGFVVQGYNAEELEKVSFCAVCCTVRQSFLDSRNCLLALANLTDPVNARWMQVSERSLFQEALSQVLGISASVFPFPGSEWLSMDIVSVSDITKHDANAMSTTVTPAQHETFGAALNTTVGTNSTPATRDRTTTDNPARNDSDNDAGGRRLRGVSRALQRDHNAIPTRAVRVKTKECEVQVYINALLIDGGWTLIAYAIFLLVLTLILVAVIVIVVVCVKKNENSEKVAPNQTIEMTETNVKASPHADPKHTHMSTH